VETIKNNDNRATQNAKSWQIDFSAKMHLLNSIESSGFEDEPYFTMCETAEDIIKFVKGRFISEYQWRVDQVGELAAATDWLQGLALNIEWANLNILEMAVSWGSLPEEHTETQADNILDNYWHFMANKLLQLMRETSQTKMDRYNEALNS
jgi:hypothetical protein